MLWRHGIGHRRGQDRGIADRGEPVDGGYGQQQRDMEIGEPDFESPEPVVEAGIAALRAGRTHYTPATGLPALRQAISEHYQHSYGVEVDAKRIIITPGASGALQLAFGVLFNAGDQILMADPSYPCNRHFAHFFGACP